MTMVIRPSPYNQVHIPNENCGLYLGPAIRDPTDSLSDTFLRTETWKDVDRWLSSVRTRPFDKLKTDKVKTLLDCCDLRLLLVDRKIEFSRKR